MPKPFEQLPFDALPDVPRVPHAFFDVPERHVDVRTDALGTVRTSVRVLGSGPPLLLVHGLMTTGYSWRYAMPALARDRTVVVPDLVGAGRTDKPDRPLTPEAVADWLRALQEALGIVGCDVVGNSMGGYLGLWLALRHPDAVGRLVDLHGPGRVEPRLVALWGAIRLPGARGILGALVRRDPERWAHRNVHYQDETLKSREEAREYGHVLATPDGLTGFWRQLRDMMDVRGIRRLHAHLAARRASGAGFPVPLLLLYTRQPDPMVSPDVGRALARAIPDARLVWLDQGSHFAHVDALDGFLEATRAFLDDAEVAGGTPPA